MTKSPLRKSERTAKQVTADAMARAGSAMKTLSIDDKTDSSAKRSTKKTSSIDDKTDSSANAMNSDNDRSEATGPGESVNTDSTRNQVERLAEQYNTVPFYQRFFGQVTSNPFEDKIAVKTLTELNRKVDSANDACLDHYSNNQDREKVFNRVKTHTSSVDIDAYMQATCTLVTCFDANMQQR